MINRTEQPGEESFSFIHRPPLPLFIHANLAFVAPFAENNNRILRRIEKDTKAIRIRLEDLHEKVDALPKTMLRLHEDTVPRLFIVLPEDGNWSMDSLFTRKYHLYFLCEHERIENGKAKPQYHIAYHEGYSIHQPKQVCDI